MNLEIMDENYFVKNLYRCIECLVYPSCGAICPSMKNQFGLLGSNIRNIIASYLDSPVKYFTDYTISKTSEGLTVVFHRNSDWPKDEQEVIIVLTNKQLEQYFTNPGLIDLIQTSKICISRRSKVEVLQQAV
jgi:hypothetical protein